MNQLPDEKPGASTVIREEQRSMATSPTISIVVPVYNTQRYLQECLDSLLKQSLSDIEIICIDDGSTDGSPAMIDEAASADPRVKAIHQANAGVSAARNHGLELARGTYVLFVDSDDFIRHDTCELLHKVAERDTADIIVFGGKTFPSASGLTTALPSAPRPTPATPSMRCSAKSVATPSCATSCIDAPCSSTTTCASTQSCA